MKEYDTELYERYIKIKKDEGFFEAKMRFTNVFIYMQYVYMPADLIN